MHIIPSKYKYQKIRLVFGHDDNKIIAICDDVNELVPDANTKNMSVNVAPLVVLFSFLSTDPKLDEKKHKMCQNITMQQFKMLHLINKCDIRACGT